MTTAMLTRPAFWQGFALVCTVSLARSSVRWSVLLTLLLLAWTCVLALRRAAQEAECAIHDALAVAHAGQAQSPFRGACYEDTQDEEVGR